MPRARPRLYHGAFAVTARTLTIARAVTRRARRGSELRGKAQPPRQASQRANRVRRAPGTISHSEAAPAPTPGARRYVVREPSQTPARRHLLETRAAQ